MTLTTPDLDSIAAFVEAEVDAAARPLYRPCYNLAPSGRSWIVREEGGRRRLVPALWGLPSGGGRLLVNARAESAGRNDLRDAFARRRCLVAADGFFEWTGPKADRRPIWFHPREGLLLFAALYDEGPSGPRFVILTTAANARVRPVHDRMPAIIARSEVGRWLAGPPEIVPSPAELLIATAVSSRVNRAEHDDPACLEPAVAQSEPKRGQLALF